MPAAAVPTARRGSEQPLVRLFAGSLAPLTHSLARLLARLTRSAALIHSLPDSLSSSWEGV